MSVLEIGGANVPNYRPNLDRRKAKNVDIQADLEYPLPLKSETFDMVYSQFAMEHISWRKIPQFISEIYRILKLNGIVIIVTADLRAQCQYILRKPAWTFAEVETIFGSQDYGENAHKSSMSQEHAITLFKDAGFKCVKTSQVGICATDMLIEGIK